MIRPALVLLLSLASVGCYRSVEVGREQVAKLAVTDPGRVTLYDRVGRGHILSDAQSLTLVIADGPVDCTDWGPATTAIRCTDGSQIPLQEVTSANLRVLSPARTTLLISAPLAVTSGLAAGLFHWRGSSAQSDYESLGPDAPADAFEDERRRAERSYDARNVAIGVAIAAGVGVAAGALWGALFEE